MVEADIKHDDATGCQQLRWKVAGEGVARQVETMKAEVFYGTQDDPLYGRIIGFSLWVKW
jgi:hypothetical protein